MEDLTKNTAPFGLLDAETQAALQAHGGPYQVWSLSGEWIDWVNPGWSLGTTYRVKPQSPTKPNIDWSHVAKEYNWLARNKGGDAWLYEQKPRALTYGDWSEENMAQDAFVFASFTPGTCDWRDSLVQRPEDV